MNEAISVARLSFADTIRNFKSGFFHSRHTTKAAVKKVFPTPRKAWMNLRLPPLVKNLAMSNWTRVGLGRSRM
jgi:hypothetical protein